MIQRQHHYSMIGSIAAYSVLLACCYAQGAKTIRINDSRPVIEALRRLEDMYGWQMTYEDPPYESEKDLVDLSDANFIREHQGRRLIGPRSAPFDFRFSIPLDGTTPDQDAVLQDLIRAHGTSGNAGIFAIGRTGAISHIEPTRLVTKQGQTITVHSILDAPISFPRARRTSLETLQLLLSAINAQATAKVATGMLATSVLARVTSDEGPHEESAKSVLVRILDDVNKWSVGIGAGPLHIVWQLTYEPDSKVYFFNTHTVTVEEKDSSGKVVGRRPI